MTAPLSYPHASMTGMTRLRIIVQRHLVRLLNRATCRAYDRLVDLENR